MDNLKSDFDLRAVLRCRLAGRLSTRLFFERLSLLLLLLLVGSKAAADVRNSPLPSVELVPSFAIADFDGDNRPDLARIEAERIDSFYTDYWIHLQLSAAGVQSIRIVAPSGGLLVAAYDVNNGNHFIDLVLTTAWSRKPIAILINDGRGRFSRVEPKAFPEIFANSDANWASSPLRRPARATFRRSRRRGSACNRRTCHRSAGTLIQRCFRIWISFPVLPPSRTQTAHHRPQFGTSGRFCPSADLWPLPVAVGLSGKAIFLARRSFERHIFFRVGKSRGPAPSGTSPKRRRSGNEGVRIVSESSHILVVEDDCHSVVPSGRYLSLRGLTPGLRKQGARPWI